MLENSLSHYLLCEQLTMEELDILLADGWRHFGTFFFRDRLNISDQEIYEVLPLRINLKKFSLSDGLKKIYKQNKSTEVLFRDAFIDEEKERLFELHIARFTKNIPQSLLDFLSPQPDHIPCKTVECCLFEANRLFAVSFLDIGKESTSSVYAMFDPEYARKSPGIYTLLCEIEYSIRHKKNYLYTGYAYRESSHYDYKKRFRGTEYYNWQGKWLELNPQ